ncbi:MAG: glycosyltransferase family 4 protein, partial [Candidatus Pacebacteria bacterium CG10_big_fil_rev_8_21_14_0_10_44_11]
MTNQQFSQFRIAIIYDHLTTQFGGAELVLQTLVELFPQAPIYTSVFQPSAASWIDPKKVRTSFLQKLPWLKFKHQLMVILHPLAFESFDLTQFELIISVTAGAAKGVLTNPNQLHLCYQLTPPRYLYGQTQQITKYFESFWLLRFPLTKMIIRPITNYLQRWDQVAVHRPDKTIAISKLVAKRIKQNYQIT